MTRTFPAAVFEESDPRAINSARVVPFEANIQRVGNCVIGYTRSPAPAGAPVVRREYTLVEMTGRGYRNALTALVGARRRDGVVNDDIAGWATVVADIAAAVHGPAMTLARAGHLAVSIGIDIPRDLLAPFVTRAAQWRRSPDYRPLSGAEVGKLVRLSWRERDEIGTKKITAFDESPEACRKRKNAASQAALRAARGVKPRAPAAVTATKWKTLGMSKSSYYARGLHKLDADVTVSHLEGNDDFAVQNPGNDDAAVQKIDPMRPLGPSPRGNDDFPVQKGAR